MTPDGLLVRSARPFATTPPRPSPGSPRSAIGTSSCSTWWASAGPWRTPSRPRGCGPSRRTSRSPARTSRPSAPPPPTSGSRWSSTRGSTRSAGRPSTTSPGSRATSPRPRPSPRATGSRSATTTTGSSSSPVRRTLRARGAGRAAAARGHPRARHLLGGRWRRGPGGAARPAGPQGQGAAPQGRADLARHEPPGRRRRGRDAVPGDRRGGPAALRVVELDDTRGDRFEALARSRAYLVREGLA